MDTDYHHHHSFSLLRDLAAFFFTVAVCGLFLVATGSVGNSSVRTTDVLSELATPRPPAPLSLLTETFDFVPEPLCVSPEIDFAEIDVRSEEQQSEAPESLQSREKIPFHGIIVQVAGRYQVDPHLIQAIIFAESGYNPKAKSKKGARGLMQLMPSTAEALGVQDIFDPAENIEGGVRYFKELLERFDGDVKLALAAYNAGSRHVRNYEGIPPFEATRRYVKKVLKFHQIFKMEKSTIS